MFAQTAGVTNFETTALFGEFAFSEHSFAVRCMYSTKDKSVGSASYLIVHNVLIKEYNDGQLVAEWESAEIRTKKTTEPKSFTAGFHH